MPANSLIIGVDIAPIRPIPRTITFQSDITSDACRATLRAYLKTWKAETVLHDGAPNVGTAWVQDAFSQAELVLQALKLATELLDEGGTFVTKVFRSKDYNPLLWVFNQLFSKVEATKPPSSRNVSAEIFVVCRGFKAPKKLDPKLLDPRSVFADLAEPALDNEAKVFKPEKKRRKRGGYDEDEYTQFKETYAKDFIQATDPISILASYNRLVFRQEGGDDILSEAVGQSPFTTAEVRQCCGDLKVLGRKEFRILLRWRLQLRERLGFVNTGDSMAATEDDGLVKVAPLDDELRLQQELQLMNEAHIGRRKREKRRENARKQREIIRMQMHMLAPHDLGMEQNGPNGGDQLFAASTLEPSQPDGFGRLDGLSSPAAAALSREAISLGVCGNDEQEQGELDDENYESNDGDRLDAELDLMYFRYQARRANSALKARIRKARQEHDDDWEGVSEHELSGSERNGSDSEVSSVRGSSEDALNADNVESEGSMTLTKRASLFFDQEDLRDIIGGLSNSNYFHTTMPDGGTTLLSEAGGHPHRDQQNTGFLPISSIENAYKKPDGGLSVATKSTTSSLPQNQSGNPQQVSCTTYVAHATELSQKRRRISDNRCYMQSPENCSSKLKPLL